MKPDGERDDTTIPLVAVRVMMHGTHRGEFFGVPPTGKRVTVSGIHILRIANGKIVEHWGNNDDLGMMQQLGVAPAMVYGKTEG